MDGWMDGCMDVYYKTRQYINKTANKSDENNRDYGMCVVLSCLFPLSLSYSVFSDAVLVFCRFKWHIL